MVLPFSTGDVFKRNTLIRYRYKARIQLRTPMLGVQLPLSDVNLLLKIKLVLNIVRIVRAPSVMASLRNGDKNISLW